MDAAATVRAYYAALDEERYEDLRALLAPGFSQERPDRTFDDRETFVEFMARDRPHADTTHRIQGVFARDTDHTHESYVEDGVAVHRISGDSVDATVDATTDGAADATTDGAADATTDGAADATTDSASDGSLATNGGKSTSTNAQRQTVLVRGVVEDASGGTIVRFVDVFDVLADRIVTLVTYTH